MAQEFETKVLDINVSDVRNKLLGLGAKECKEKIMRRWVFTIDSPDDVWIRLRDDGKKTTITYKNRKSHNISDTEEIEIDVSDFDKAAELLSKLNFKDKYYQENKRIIFILRDIEFSVDTWPSIPTYLEVESSSEEKVKEGLRLLGFENKDIGNMSVVKVYAKYGIDLHSFKNLTFNNFKN